MRLRYVYNNETEVAEIIRMYHQGDTGYFVRADGAELALSDVPEEVWLRLVGNMFTDGNLSLPANAGSKLTIRTATDLMLRRYSE